MNKTMDKEKKDCLHLFPLIFPTMMNEQKHIYPAEATKVKQATYSCDASSKASY